MTDLLYTFSTDITSLSLNEKLLCALIVTLLCMGIVICVLTVLMFILKGMDKIFSLINNLEEKTKLEMEKASVEVVDDALLDTLESTDIPATNSDEEIVCAIFSAVYASMSDTDQRGFVVNKVKRKSDNKTLWQRESRVSL